MKLIELTEVDRETKGTLSKQEGAVMVAVHLLLRLKGNVTHNILHIHKPLLTCQVMENVAGIENIRDVGDVKVNLLPHFKPVLLQQSKCVLNHTSTPAVSFVEVCLYEDFHHP